MRKGFLIVLAVVLVAALAAPAMAGMDVTGFVRDKGYVSNFKNGATAPVLKEGAPDASYVEQRFRVKFSFGEENVKAVWFLETDFGAFGDAAGNANTTTPATGASRNAGGALGGDRINTETKNIYVWFKVPNTSLDFTVGLQNQSDAYAGLLYGGADMAGIFATGKFEPVSYKLGWAKLYENDYQKTDDLTLYVAEVKFAPTKDVKVGGNFYYLQDDTHRYSSTTMLPVDPGTTTYQQDIYTLGVDASFNAGPVTISGFGLYQFGTRDYAASATKDIDISAYAVDVRADATLGPGKGFLEGLYISGSSLAKDGDDYESIVTLSDVNASPGGNSFFARTDMQILLPNADDINTNTALIGAAGNVSGQSPGNGGRGIWHVAAGYTMKFGDKLTGKVGAGYLSATELLKTDQNKSTTALANTRKGEGMGTEVNANVNYNIMKGLDFGLYGAYAFLGDFYKSSGSVVKDPDDVYDVHFRLNYAF